MSKVPMCPCCRSNGNVAAWVENGRHWWRCYPCPSSLRNRTFGHLFSAADTKPEPDPVVSAPIKALLDRQAKRARSSEDSIYYYAVGENRTEGEVASGDYRTRVDIKNHRLVVEKFHSGWWGRNAWREVHRVSFNAFEQMKNHRIVLYKTCIEWDVRTGKLHDASAKHRPYPEIDHVVRPQTTRVTLTEKDLVSDGMKGIADDMERLGEACAERATAAITDFSPGTQVEMLHMEPGQEAERYMDPRTGDWIYVDQPEPEEAAPSRWWRVPLFAASLLIVITAGLVAGTFVDIGQGNAIAILITDASVAISLFCQYLMQRGKRTDGR